jgi:hypothetical protein
MAALTNRIDVKKTRNVAERNKDAWETIRRK